jgi:prepilin-type N-terminal cleavage/methylation domain-containing protein
MIAGRVGGDRRGLTLIELVLTLTILAVAGALVSGAFTTGLRAWQSGARSGREELVARIVLERIAAQVRAAVHSPARLNGEEAVAFEAGEDHLRFVTLAAAGAAPVQVFYGLSGGGAERSLVYREYPWPDKEFFGGGRPRREERVEEITGFTVVVAKRSDDAGDDAGTALVEWSPLDLELPESVTVEIAIRPSAGPEPSRYRITVPVMAREAL